MSSAKGTGIWRHWCVRHCGTIAQNQQISMLLSELIRLTTC